MTSFPLLVLVLQSCSGLHSLPAPVLLNVTSVNFSHVLHWDPGPGSPEGTRYRTAVEIPGKKPRFSHKSTSQTSFKQKLDSIKEYNLAVQALYNHTLSHLSNKITFVPYKDTIIGPPALSLAGCGTCIQGNISLPVADRNINYDPSFSVFWRKEKDRKIYVRNISDFL
uniref:Interferon alpha/beta receptor 2-like n=1 Tax=Kryptolebias marmoratus TaxID=37003 RepID=A0A3Q3ARR9_KRYMA